MTDKRELKVEVEGEFDASTLRALQRVTNEFSDLAKTVVKLETAMNQMMNKTLPKGLAEVSRQLGQVAAVSQNFKTLSQAAGIVGTGGPSAMMRNAAVRGVRAQTNALPEMTEVAVMREGNRVLEARRRLYQQLRAEMPEASSRQIVGAFRDRLSGLDAAYATPAERRRAISQAVMFERERMGAVMEERKRAFARDAAKVEREIRRRERLERSEQRPFALQERADAIAIERERRSRERAFALQERADAAAIERERNRRAKLSEREDNRRRNTFIGFEHVDAKVLDRQITQAQRDQDRMARMTMDEVSRFDRALHNKFKMAAGKIAKITDAVERERAFNTAASDLGAFAGRRGINIRQADLRDVLDEAMLEQRLRGVGPAPAPKAPKPVPTRRERAQEAFAMRNEMMGLNGGADQFMSQAGYMRNYALMAGGIGAGAFAFGSTIELEKSLAQLQAISRATDPELQRIQETIFKIGQNSRFTAQELAEASTVMAQAGYSAGQIEKSMPAIANLATGTGATMEEAVNILTSVLDVWDLNVGRSEEIANTLTAALNSSKLSLEQLSLGIQYAGNIAAQSGIEYEELAAALGAMANAGIKSGSTLGTGFRAMIQQLMDPTSKLAEELKGVGLSVEDVDIKTRGLMPVMQSLRDVGFGSAQAFSSMEIRAAAAFTALSGNLPFMQQMDEEIRNTNAATEAAAIQLDTFAANWTQLQNAVTQFMTTAGAPLLEFFTGLIEQITALVLSASEAGPLLEVLIAALGTMAVLGTAKWLVGLAAGLLGVQTAAAGAAGAVTLFGHAVKLSPFGMFVAAASLATAALAAFEGKSKDADEALQASLTTMNEYKGEAEEFKARVVELDTYLDKLNTRHAMLADNQFELTRATEIARQKFGEWGAQLQGNIGTIDVLISKIRELKREQAAEQLNRLELQRAQTGVSKTAAQIKADEKTAEASRTAAFLLKDGGAQMFTGLQQAALRRVAARKYSPEDVALIQQLAVERGSSSFFANAFQSGLTRLSGSLGEANVASRQVTVLSAQEKALDNSIVDTRVLQADPRINSAAAMAANSMARVLEQNRNSLKGLTGADRNRQIIKNEENLQATLANNRMLFGGVLDNLSLRDPQAMERAVALAKERGEKVDTPEQRRQALMTYLQRNPEIRGATSGRTANVALDPKVMTGRGKELEELGNALIAEGRTKEGLKALAEGKAMRLNAKFLNGEDVTDVALYEAEQGANDAKVRKAAARAARTSERDQEKLERKAAESAKRVADDAQRQAEETVERTEYAVTFLGQNLNEAYAEVQQAWELSLNAALDAAKKEADAQDLDTDARAAEIRKIRKDHAQKVLESQLALIQASLDAQLARLDREQLTLDARSVSIAALDNAFNRNVGDVRRYTYGELASDRLGVDQARLDFRRAEAENQAANDSLAAATKAGDPEKMRAAAQAAETTAIALERARLNLQAMTEVAPEFASATEAIGAAWTQFSNTSGINASLFDQMADGALGVFEQIRGGMKTLVTDVLSGTKSMGDAFRDFGLSVVQSMLDMAAQMMANTAMKWLMSLFMRAFSGFGRSSTMPVSQYANMTEIPLPAPKMWHGGQVRRMANGGANPNRDSVLAALMPGEFVMSKSATDMVGVDNLARINAMGNRRMSDVSRSQPAGEMQDCTVNIWVVTPDQKPQSVGKRDIIAVVSDDIESGGRIKKLVKSVQLGQL